MNPDEFVDDRDLSLVGKVEDGKCMMCGETTSDLYSMTAYGKKLNVCESCHFERKDGA